jgi:hypothetical protein
LYALIPIGAFFSRILGFRLVAVLLISAFDARFVLIAIEE